MRGDTIYHKLIVGVHLSVQNNSSSMFAEVSLGESRSFTELGELSQLTLLPNTRRTEKAVLGKFFVMRNAERRESGFCFS